ncbi:MAG: hypothetical protein ACRCVX_16550 [Shewanella sp.]
MTQPFAIETVVHGGKIDEKARRLVLDHMGGIPDGESVLFAVLPKNEIVGALSVMPIIDLMQTAEAIKALLNITIDHNIPNDCLDLLNELGGWMGQAAALQSSAKYYLCIAESAQYAEMLENIDDYKLLSVTERKQMIAARCAEYVALYELAQRLGAAMTHRCDHLRTLVSWHKSDRIISDASSSVPQTRPEQWPSQ